MRRTGCSRWICCAAPARASSPELLGAGLLDADRHIRLHQFRRAPTQALAALDAPDRALLEAYAEGVNAAIASLGARPFEYLLLRATPAPWRAEDSLLVVYAMWIDLQGLDDRNEQQQGRLAATLPEPRVPPADRAGSGERGAARRQRAAGDAAADAGGIRPAQARPRALRAAPRQAGDAPQRRTWRTRTRVRGGQQQLGRRRQSRAKDGGALVANDMHLGLTCRTSGIARGSSSRRPALTSPA